MYERETYPGRDALSQGARSTAREGGRRAEEDDLDELELAQLLPSSAFLPRPAALISDLIELTDRILVYCCIIITPFRSQPL